MHSGYQGRPRQTEFGGCSARSADHPVGVSQRPQDVIAPVVDDRLALFPGYRLIGQTREGVVYPLNPTAWLTDACTVVRRDLSPAEWATYIPNRPHHPTCTDLR